MKAVTVKEINQELINRSPKELRDICLRLSRFKKENKELLTYLLFESSDEASYIDSVKSEIDLLIYYCTKLMEFSPSVKKNKGLQKLYDKQIETIIIKVSSLHEDLQYDYGLELEALNQNH